MRTYLIAIVLATSTVYADEITIELEASREPEPEYGGQLIAKFFGLLESNEELKTEFAKFEAGPMERAGGRYMGADASAFVLHRGEDVDFGADAGWRAYTQTLVIYYSFAEGYRKGMTADTGVFAVFEINGEENYVPKDDKFELKDATVTATFKGFTKTLEADREQGQ